MPVFLLVYMMPVNSAEYYAMAVLVIAFITDVLDG
ncbi:MAG: CDP-diacylglycerol--glycerol-3-phosphate 3-phosphatidyltransferase, partial [Clostridia bacterium]|nr:CDP-diacylglycerol--glycerol-3-phosphate 3-phosphatidyltransferase [Clostridia bacterium]